MKTCFISRFGGFGDVLHAAHLPELIKKHYKVDHITFETNYNGYQILQGNPFIDELIHVDITKVTDNRLKKNWDYMEEKHDLFFNLIDTIELKYCVQEHDSRYYRDTTYRRENFGGISYYDVMTKAIGLSEKYFGTRGHLYYPASEHLDARSWVAKTREKYGVDNIILINLSGSSLHKRFMGAEIVSRSLLEDKKNMVILTGDEHCKDDVFAGERVLSKVASWNFRTAALMTNYMDLTISVETGLPLVAHSWDAPCLQLLTAASHHNHCKYAKHAHWMQAPIYCSPCHKNPQNYWGCPQQNKMPACVYFNWKSVADKAKEILANERS